MTSYQEALITVVARYECAVSLQDRIVERDRRLGLDIKGDEDLLERLFVSLEKARIALERSRASVSVN